MISVATKEKVRNECFQAELYIDHANERIRVDEFRGDPKKLLIELEQMRQEKPFTKLIIYAKPTQWQRLLPLGFELEAIFKGYFNGVDNYAMCRFFTNERKNCGDWIAEDQIMEGVLNKPISKGNKDLPPGYQLRRANQADIEALASFYARIFSSYPVPISEPAYLQKLMSAGAIFYLATFEAEIVCAASADVNAVFHNAEMTDCATDPAHRQYGLIKHLIKLIERELYSDRILSTYSIARANSFGMNSALHQLGYEYQGRLTNNCFMEGAYENLNVWVKNQH
ncbi:hypothetical protein AJ85_01915 [Alkalihalobacillus alcalophilus ATCC 27647 = CGMCC 1.3604]|uniref:N-acetyltransferase domain-containing protein n=1 Tax=Alkalihalobacillus alcalophilus ATCC 27647 = CGMCC 1.3604 TaxID=1218173 RepID=A0A094WRJ6_ALKAL|nr:putative beta-lysine N-acetyltransferase [Alkalihalobacillus alcalophilus]KGA98673.1 hypothetical protein BALCAV_0202665 [Alkalihalobacillus alcalophilus ATCC 27647 = CGMCC 1.3604]MED1560297.1 putative beta-lysine N-acetyltransferase [Alkalihalobacillus alcalophilus]THG88619.1 hypothetical protein AJ85_01915 [Alkalihalobacillus alcalophilus ATCC 27647 = CGMCC 1.3604]